MGRWVVVVFKENKELVFSVGGFVLVVQAVMQFEAERSPPPHPLCLPPPLVGFMVVSCDPWLGLDQVPPAVCGSSALPQCQRGRRAPYLLPGVFASGACGGLHVPCLRLGCVHGPVVAV